MINILVWLFIYKIFTLIFVCVIFEPLSGKGEIISLLFELIKIVLRGRQHDNITLLVISIDDKE